MWISCSSQQDAVSVSPPLNLEWSVACFGKQTMAERTLYYFWVEVQRGFAYSALSLLWTLRPFYKELSVSLLEDEIAHAEKETSTTWQRDCRPSIPIPMWATRQMVPYEWSQARITELPNKPSSNWCPKELWANKMVVFCFVLFLIQKEITGFKMVPKMCSYNKSWKLVTLALIGCGLIGEDWKNTKKTVSRREKQWETCQRMLVPHSIWRLNNLQNQHS